MPRQNNFEHQQYTDADPTAPFELIDAPFPPQAGTEPFAQQMEAFAVAIQAHVDAIYLIHGTFVGQDALGWTAQIEKFWPQAAEQLRRLGKKLVDVLADDKGNFTSQYVDWLQQNLRPSAPKVPVRLFCWSGENNHVARCVAAIELLDVLIRRFSTEKRILLLCHSHAGNVLALITNLLGADEEHRRIFQETIKPIYRDDAEVDQFLRVSDWLADDSHRSGLKLDVVTLGTPIRYGWDSAGYRHLLHFVHHVPRAGTPDYLSPLNEWNSRAIRQLDGDFAQQFGIAGTNILPYVFDLTLQTTELKLGKLLQPFGRTNFLKHLKIGMRVPEEGRTLLVKYDDTNGLARQLAGHSVYTQLEWLAFHGSEIANRFYG
jgi:hypothetical protein